MTELNLANKKVYMDLCKGVWSFSKESLDYLNKRLSDEWEPIPEIKNLITSVKGQYEDQRLRIDLDMSDSSILSIFEKDDEAYKMFKSKFAHALAHLNETYGIIINYKNFIDNKITFKKNLTKIKKVLELMYAESKQAYKNDTGSAYTEKNCADYIIRSYERIGACKKSGKKLQFVISLNPIDWLLASTSEKNFSSCLNLSNPSGGYQYCLGLPFLAGDKNRMMLYLTDGSTKEFMGIKVDSVQQRTWCILDKKDMFTIVKWYPNDTVGVEPVKAITKVNNFTSRTSFEEGKYPLDVLATTKGLTVSIYNDMGQWLERDGKLWHSGKDKCGQQYFTKNLIQLNKGNTRNSFSFGNFRHSIISYNSHSYNIPYWKKAGFNLDCMTDTMTCTCCNEADKGGFAVRDGGIDKFYCYDCFKDNTCTCYICRNSKLKNESSGKEYTKKNGVKVFVCDDCASSSRIKRLVCSKCNTIHEEDLSKTADGTYICPECSAKEKYSKCSICNCLDKGNSVYFNTFTKVSKIVCKKCSYESSESIETYGKFWRTIKTKAGAVIE